MEAYAKGLGTQDGYEGCVRGLLGLGVGGVEFSQGRAETVNHDPHPKWRGNRLWRGNHKPQSPPVNATTPHPQTRTPKLQPLTPNATPLFTQDPKCEVEGPRG